MISVESLKDIVIHTLEEAKAQEIVTLDVTGRTSITDFMIICHGTSSRHTKSVSDRVVEAVKKENIQPLSVQGEETCEWILVDLGDIIVYIMLKSVREFYQIEKLWSV